MNYAFRAEMTVEETNLETFSQFSDEEVINLNDLPLTKDVGEIHKSGRVQSDTCMNSSNMMLKEMSIVKARIGFDEQQFRNDCQKLQTAMSGEFKSSTSRHTKQESHSNAHRDCG